MDKVFSIKVDQMWLTWVAQLARETKRSRAALVRDLIYFLMIAPAGQEVAKLMAESQVHYDR